MHRLSRLPCLFLVPLVIALVVTVLEVYERHVAAPR